MVLRKLQSLVPARVALQALLLRCAGPPSPGLPPRVWPRYRPPRRHTLPLAAGCGKARQCQWEGKGAYNATHGCSACPGGAEAEQVQELFAETCRRWAGRERGMAMHAVLAAASAAVAHPTAAHPPPLFAHPAVAMGRTTARMTTLSSTWVSGSVRCEKGACSSMQRSTQLPRRSQPCPADHRSSHVPGAVCKSQAPEQIPQPPSPEPPAQPAPAPEPPALPAPAPAPEQGTAAPAPVPVPQQQQQQPAAAPSPAPTPQPAPQQQNSTVPPTAVASSAPPSATLRRWAALLAGAAAILALI